MSDINAQASKNSGHRIACDRKLDTPLQQQHCLQAADYIVGSQRQWQLLLKTNIAIQQTQWIELPALSNSKIG